MVHLRTGIVGAGLISKLRHIPAFKKMKNDVELSAVCDLNEELANRIAHEFNIPNYYTDFSEMLSKEDLDIVDICVPPQIHAPLAIEAIESGANVIIEKPMALKTSECDKMISKAKKQDVKLCVVHNNIFHPPFLKAKELIDKGEIGDFIGMRIVLSTPKSEILDMKDHWYHKLPGGMIGETGPHMAYMSLEFLKNIKNVDIHAKNLLKYPWAPFDEFRIELEGENGYSSVNLSYTSDCHIANVSILGTKAELNIDLVRMLITKYDLYKQDYKSIGKSSLGTASQLVKGVASNFWGVTMGNRKIGTEVVIERFFDAISNGSPIPVTGKEGRETVRIMEMTVNRLNEKYGN